MSMKLNNEKICITLKTFTLTNKRFVGGKGSEVNVFNFDKINVNVLINVPIFFICLS